MTDIEVRAQTMAEALKKKVTTLQNKKELEEICVICVDVSGSMNGACGSSNRIEVVRRSIPFLRAGNRWIGYSLVDFDSESHIVQELTTAFSNIVVNVDMLIPRGQTSYAAGLTKSLEVFKDRISQKKRIILLSDGGNNTDLREMPSVIAQCREMGVVVDTIAFGEEADLNQLRDLAAQTGGVFKQANSPLALEQTYRELNFDVRWIEHKTV